MASPLQQASFRRKMYYVAVILGLFTLSIFWRGGRIGIPLSSAERVKQANELRRLEPADRERVAEKMNVAAAPSAVHGFADWLASWTVEAQAAPSALDLRELDQGDAEISSSAARLSLTGARGFMVAALWRAAIEQQKRNEWEKLEILVRAVTRLQPNFATPWIYQSWNMAYNVSVENDRLGDTYFYIARGIELLAEGERLNSKPNPFNPTEMLGSPDMRYWCGFYYQNKFGVSDKVITLRSLAQLSNIPIQDRKPSLFRKQNGEFNVQAFQDFVRKNPQLVRRLRDKLNYRRPEEIVQFLDDNQKIPSRFDAESRLLPPDQQFPILPPDAQYRTAEFQPTDAFDAFHAALTWFDYAQKVVPPPSRMPVGYFELSGEAKFKYRMPKSPALIIFRYSPSRAQTNLAERLAKEGWFDDTSKWYPDEFADIADERWYPLASGTGGPGEGLATTTSSVTEWLKAYSYWDQYGTDNGMILSQIEQARLEQLGRNVPFDPTLREKSDEELKARGFTREQVLAAAAKVAYNQNRSMTNFPFFLAQSEAEKKEETARARRTLYLAEQAELSGNKGRAIDLYARATAEWREVLAGNPNFHHPGSDRVEEDSYEQFLNLPRLLTDSERVTNKVNRLTDAVRAVVPVDDPKLKQDLRATVAEQEAGYLAAAASSLVKRRMEDPKLASQVPAGVIPGTVAFADLQVVRNLVAQEFGWLPTFTSELRQDQWTNPDTRRAVQERKGLVRPAGPPPDAAPPPGMVPPTSVPVPSPAKN